MRGQECVGCLYGYLQLHTSPNHGRFGWWVEHLMNINTKKEILNKILHTVPFSGSFKIITPNKLGISIWPPYLEPLQLSRIWVKSQMEPQSKPLPLVMLITCPNIVDTCSPEMLSAKVFLLMKLNSLSFCQIQVIQYSFPVKMCDYATQRTIDTAHTQEPSVYSLAAELKWAGEHPWMESVLWFL